MTSYGAGVLLVAVTVGVMFALAAISAARGIIIVLALAAATQRAKTRNGAECEASQSGGDSRNAQ